jgi:hypothetical protein
MKAQQLMLDLPTAPAGRLIPPLPTPGGSTIGTRHQWIQLVTRQNIRTEAWVRAEFERVFGREPDRGPYAEPFDGGVVWWIGWVSKDEALLWTSQGAP